MAPCKYFKIHILSTYFMKKMTLLSNVTHFNFLKNNKKIYSKTNNIFFLKAYLGHIFYFINFLDLCYEKNDFTK